jgi:hypothetical protein
MEDLMRTVLVLWTVSILGLAGLPAAAAEPAVTLAPSQVTWGPAPPVIPPGAKLAVLFGDPGKDGPFVMRLKLPANYKIAPHAHSRAEDVTVISGSFNMGMGDKIDRKASHALGAGGFSHLPAGMTHYAMAGAKGATLQVSGMGPFDIKYVNPADDPSLQAKR